MTSTPRQPVEPLKEIVCSSNITAAADGVPEDDEARWKRWCTEAGVPDAYIPPGKAEAGRVAKKVKEAKKKRHHAMRICIARARAAAAPAGGTLEPPPTQAGAGPSAAGPDADGMGVPNAAAPEADSASAPRVDDEDELIFPTQMPAGRPQTGLVGEQGSADGSTHRVTDAMKSWRFCKTTSAPCAYHRLFDHPCYMLEPTYGQTYVAISRVREAD